MYAIGKALCRYSPIAAALAIALVTSGCQQKMADQPSFRPLQPSSFFDDGLSSRPLVAGTVARGHLRSDRAFYLGRSTAAEVEQPPAANAPTNSDSDSEPLPDGFDENRVFVEEFPFPITESVIRHGYNRYMIYCVVCHDALGTGRGKIVERGYTAPPSYHTERLRNDPVGRLFAVASEGYGSMPAYAEQIPPEDRWAIVAYLRALQLSQHFSIEDLTPEMQQRLSENTAASQSRAEAAPNREQL